MAIAEVLILSLLQVAGSNHAKFIGVSLSEIYFMNFIHDIIYQSFTAILSPSLSIKFHRPQAPFPFPTFT